MKLAINLIKVDDDVRIRKEIGDLQPLVDSISKVGLINPILIDEQSNLVAGFRRLEACKTLKMEEVEVKVVEFGGDLIKMLDAEVAENFFRKDFTPEELLATERRRQEIIEATRKKGMFERSWIWLKNLFVPRPVPPKESLPTAQPPTENGDAPSGPDESEPAERAVLDDMETEEQPVKEEQPVNKRDDRSIKWRDS